MKTTRFTESQIVQALKEYEGGKKAEALCRELGITQSTLYNWKKKYAGLDGEQLRRLKELEEENRKLKSMYADLALDNKMLKDVLSKKW
jgi:putative transposase